MPFEITYATVILILYAILSFMNVRVFRKLKQEGYNPSNFEQNELIAFLMKYTGIYGAAIITYLIFSAIIIFCAYTGVSEFMFGFACGCLIFNIIHDYMVICSVYEELKKRKKEKEVKT